MSKYTTQVRWMVEQFSPEKNISISKMLDLSIPYIFDFEYPIWREDYRKVLERKILMHYFNKEIGMETVGLWKFYMEERLNMIMPYYNQVYATTVREYDYLWDMDNKDDFVSEKDMDEKRKLQEDINQKENTKTLSLGDSLTDATDKATSRSDYNGTDNYEGNKVSDGTVENENKDLKSDLPQSNYAGLDYGTNLNEGTQNSISKSIDKDDNKRTLKNLTENDSQADTITKVDVKSDTDQNFTSENVRKNTDDINVLSNEKAIRIRTGASGARSLTDLMMQYRDSLINIDKLIIDDLKDLFMMIY